MTSSKKAQDVNMNNKETNLIWIDLEMTGLLPEKDVIIEIATIVTDKDLNILAEGHIYRLPCTLYIDSPVHIYRLLCTYI
jgi:oligoribonuclease (3'-5' exoribonuclease)